MRVSTGVVTAIITNPLWVVKTRMYTTSASSPQAYRGVTRSFTLSLFKWISLETDEKKRANILSDGLYRLLKDEGFRGASKGMTLALIGVSNGAIQFMTYEELKKWRVELRRKRIGNDSISQEELKKLVCLFPFLPYFGRVELTKGVRGYRVIWSIFS